MHILDTDHMSLLERGGPAGLRIEARLLFHPAEEIYVTVVSYEEQCQGWMAEINRAKTEQEAARYYQLFSANLLGYCKVNLLLFDKEAADIFDRLRAQRLRIGTRDLRIAAIALSKGAVVVTRNERDFAKVPGLILEDWTI